MVWLPCFWRQSCCPFRPFGAWLRPLTRSPASFYRVGRRTSKRRTPGHSRLRFCRSRLELKGAAARLRPDLADKITAAALKPRSSEDRPSCNLIGQIVKAAIAAAPDAKIAIVRAALRTIPWARECILAAAEIYKDGSASFRLLGVDGQTINPANISPVGDPRDTQSPEQPPAL